MYESAAAVVIAGTLGINLYSARQENSYIYKKAQIHDTVHNELPHQDLHYLPSIRALDKRECLMIIFLVFH